MSRPGGVTAIAGIFFLAAAYLLVIALTLLLAPGTVSLILGSPLLGGLELAGPYMFLLMSAVGAVIAAGLWRLRNWARRTAIAAALLGIVMLMPAVSSAVTGVELKRTADLLPAAQVELSRKAEHLDRRLDAHEAIRSAACSAGREYRLNRS